jgi:hypothetical protein
MGFVICNFVIPYKFQNKMSFQCNQLVRSWKICYKEENFDSSPNLGSSEFMNVHGQWLIHAPFWFQITLMTLFS